MHVLRPLSHCVLTCRRNILQNVAAPDTLTLRYTIIQCVLATDLALGPRYIAAFESRTKRPEFGHDVRSHVHTTHWQC